MEYRTCIVTETTDDGRKIEYKALFHQWIVHSGTYLSQGFLTKYENGLFAIVEYEDGTINEYLPEEIKFTDGIAEKILGNKKRGLE